MFRHAFQLALFLALAGAATARAEATASSTLHLRTAAVLRASFSLARDINFNLSPALVLGGGTTAPIRAGAWDVTTNLHNTGVVVQRSSWRHAGNGGMASAADGGAGDYAIEVLAHPTAGGGWAEIPDTEGTGRDARPIARWLKGVASSFDLQYRLSGIDSADDPGTYTSTITYTFKEL